MARATKDDLIDQKTEELRQKVSKLTRAFFVEMAKLDCEQLVVINHPLFQDNMFIGMHSSKIGSLKILDAVKLKMGEAFFEGKHSTNENSQQIIERMAKKKE